LEKDVKQLKYWMVSSLFISASFANAADYYQHFVGLYNSAASATFMEAKGFRAGVCVNRYRPEVPFGSYLYADSMRPAGPMFPPVDRFVFGLGPGKEVPEPTPVDYYEKISPQEKETLKSEVASVLSRRTTEPAVVGNALQTLRVKTSSSELGMMFTLKQDAKYFYGVVWYEKLERRSSASPGAGGTVSLGYFPHIACYFPR
jgi:hypothetical protein